MDDGPDIALESERESLADAPYLSERQVAKRVGGGADAAQEKRIGDVEPDERCAEQHGLEPLAIQLDVRQLGHRSYRFRVDFVRLRVVVAFAAFLALGFAVFVLAWIAW
jgi:hypothetical protein